jgi:predicted transcriptional regulator
MQEFSIRMLDDKDKEFALTLQKIGVHENVATILAYLMNVDRATSRQIEMGAKLRQPEVSVAAKILRQIGWLDEGRIKEEENGRPKKAYKLGVSVEEIVKHFEDEMIRESNLNQQSIQKLRQLATY